MPAMVWSSDLKEAVRSIVKSGTTTISLNESENKAVMNSIKDKNGQQTGRPRPEMWF